MTNEVIRRVLDEKRAAKRRAAAEAEARKTAALSLPDVAEAHREYVYALHESLRYGGADKKQIQLVTANLLRLKGIPRPDDAADALAVALCHAHTSRLSGLYSI